MWFLVHYTAPGHYITAEVQQSGLDRGSDRDRTGPTGFRSVRSACFSRRSGPVRISDLKVWTGPSVWTGPDQSNILSYDLDRSGPSRKNQ